jgi:hypothetical protein
MIPLLPEWTHSREPLQPVARRTGMAAATEVAPAD